MPAGIPPLPYANPIWRFLVTDLNTASITFLDRLARNRQIDYKLNRPVPIRGDVPSDNPEINIAHTDGDPFLSEGNRLLYCLRREGDTPPWVCRAAGLIMIVEDEAGTDQPTTHFTAYDPWQYLLSRPIRHDDGTLPNQYGMAFDSKHGNQIALDLLVNTITFDGGGPGGTSDCFIDYGQVGGGAYYGGTIESTVITSQIFQQGTSVGEAWNTLVQTGDMDIVLTPIYDPNNRPGITHELSIYNKAGSNRHAAIFAWDKPSRSLASIDRMLDGTARANNVQWYTGANGRPVSLQSDSASNAKYGAYWSQQFFSDPAPDVFIELLAAEQLAEAKNGKRTYTMLPVPERSPFLFTEYFLGDRVRVYASNALRAPLSTGTIVGGEYTYLQRVFGIPLKIDDDGVERLDAIILSSENE